MTHREMLGGINGDVSHASFILITFLECECPGYNDVIGRAVDYVQSVVSRTDRPLALASAAYALTLAGSPDSQVLVGKLMARAQSSPDGFTFWGPGKESDFQDTSQPYWLMKKPGALAVEATSYALLALLARGDHSLATRVAGWLAQQRDSHGAFVSTQDTVLGLQAMAEYSSKATSSVLDMTCNIRSEADAAFQKSISLNPEDALVLKSVQQVPTGGKLHLSAEGTGVGVVQVEVRFNVPQDIDSCRFELNVETHQPNTLLQSFFGDQESRCDPCDLDCDDRGSNNEVEEDEEEFESFTFPSVVPRIQTLFYRRGLAESKNASDNMTRSKIGRPTRSKRSSKALSDVVVCIKACARFLGTKTTGMSVIDVGLLTGFVPVEDDLKRLKDNGVVDHWDRSKRSVVFYVDEITAFVPTCVRFRARREHTAQNVQPARVQVYDYYNPTDRCTTFYKSDSPGKLANSCSGQQKHICACLESRCASCEESWFELGQMDLMSLACSNASYALEIKALDTGGGPGFHRLLGQVSDVASQKGQHRIKAGDKIILLQRASCICPRLEPGKTYRLLLGAPKRFRDASGRHVYAFLLDKGSLALEKVKLKSKGLSGKRKTMAKTIRRTFRRLKRRGCSNTRSKRRRKTKRSRGKTSLVASRSRPTRSLTPEQF